MIARSPLEKRPVRYRRLCTVAVCGWARPVCGALIPRSFFPRPWRQRPTRCLRFTRRGKSNPAFPRDGRRKKDETRLTSTARTHSSVRSLPGQGESSAPYNEGRREEKMFTQGSSRGSAFLWAHVCRSPSQSRRSCTVLVTERANCSLRSSREPGAEIVDNAP